MLSKRIFDHSLYILKTSRSALCLLSSKDHKPNDLSLSSYDSFFRLGTILVNLCFIRSSNCLSFEQYGDQTELQYSRCGLTNDLYNCNNTFVIFIRDYSCFCTEAGGQVDKTSCVYNTSISVLRSVSRVTGISPELQMDTICR